MADLDWSHDDTLIYDLGMHTGLDAKFYLDKGFRVVALEANPRACAAAREELSAHGDRLTVVEAALWERGGEAATFHINERESSWSSLDESLAARRKDALTPVEVPTVTLTDLFDRHGVPRYAKCDVEGADDLFVEQLAAERRRPAFASIEATREASAALRQLKGAGYDRVQMVNQTFHPSVKVPEVSREGERVEVRFQLHMSGLFGLDLPRGRWIEFDEAIALYEAFVTMRQARVGITRGWVDFHVTTARQLNRPSPVLPARGPVREPAREPVREPAREPVAAVNAGSKGGGGLLGRFRRS